MRADLGEETRHGVGDGPAVAAHVQAAQHIERIGDLAFGLGQLGARFFCQRAKRVQPAGLVPKGQQRVIAQRKERPAQRGEDAQPVVRPLDGKERIADRQHLFAIVKGTPSHQHMRDAARLEPAHVGARDILIELAETPEQQADVASRNRDPLVSFGNRPAALAHEPRDEGRSRVREGRLDLAVGDARVVAPVFVRARNRQRDDSGLVFRLGAEGRERDIAGLCRAVRATRAVWRRHRDLEGAVHQRLNRGNTAKARREIHHRGARLGEPRLDGLVEGHVRAAKAVDRLLGVPHQEELARRGDDLLVVVLRGIVGAQQQQDLGLQRVGVLELVHEEVAEAPLQQGAHRTVVAQQIARAHEQIQEVELTDAVLVGLVGSDDGLELVVQARRQVSVAGFAQRVERGLRSVALREHVRTRKLRTKQLAAALPVPVALEARARKLAQLGLESVVVARAPRRALAPQHLAGEALDRLQAAREIALRAAGPGSQRADLDQLGEHAIDRVAAVERIAPPGRLEIPVFDEPARGVAKLAARTQRIETARRAPQHTPHAFRRILQHALEPLVEAAVDQSGLLVGRHLEEWVDAGLHRSFVQQVGAEGVKRRNTSNLELSERRIEASDLRAVGEGSRSLGPRALDLRPQTQLHLARRLVGEGDGHDAIERAEAAAQNRDDPAHEFGGLTRARRGFHEERGVEILANPTARFCIGEHAGHRNALRRASPCSSRCDLRPLRISS